MIGVVNKKSVRVSTKSYNVKKVLVLTAFVSFMLSRVVFAQGDTTLWDNVNDMIESVQLQLVGMSTAAAGVGVGIGVFMKKFSMGKQDRIEMGNKIIRDTLIGFGLINAVPIILNWIRGFTA